MTDPITFTSVTPRYHLPMLFSGQSQKELTVNESLLAADILMHPLVQGALSVPPAAPVAGQCWIVGESATDAFSGKENAIAAWTENGWRFFSPARGMRVYDQNSQSYRLFSDAWMICVAPATPSGGTVVDIQARSAITAIVSLLTETGIFSPG